MFTFATGLVVTQETAGGLDWANLGAGLIGALATLIAAVITVRLQDSRQGNRRPDKIKSNDLPFEEIRERNSFAALDVVKILDLRGSPCLNEDAEGTAVLTDSHFIVREAEAGDGVIFCYATSGSITGTSNMDTYKWGQIEPHSSLKRGIPAESFALGVDLSSLPMGEPARIINRVVYRGAFDDADSDSFETHIDRNTPSLTFIVLFASSYPCQGVKGEVDLGRYQWRETKRNRPAIMEDGAMIYWRIFPNNGQNSLQHMSKYRLRWTWGPRCPDSGGATTSVSIVTPQAAHEP